MRVPVACCVPFLAFLAIASAQEQKQLTLETVLASPRLLLPAPRVLWQPTGHAGTVISTAARGVERMQHLGRAGRLVGPVTQVMQVLTAVGGREARRGTSFPPCSWLADGNLRIEHGNAVYYWGGRGERAERVLHWLPPEGETLLANATLHSVAPGDHHAAYIREHQLWLTDRDEKTRQLTADGSADVAYGGAAHRAEFGITTGMFWSPNGHYLAFSREDKSPIAEYPYQDLGSQPPTPRHGRYPMAGSTHSRVTIGVCDTVTKKVSWLANNPNADIYWTNVAIRNDGTVFVAEVNRDQDEMKLVKYDGTTGGQLAILMRETDREWIEPEHPPTFLKDGKFLWWSRRDGYRHLWLCAANGNVTHQVTKGLFDVQELLAVSDDTVWFQAAGDDPRQLHLFSAALDGSGVTQLTIRRGRHRASLSADRTKAFITWSNLETPPSSYLLDLENAKSDPVRRLRSKLDGYALPEQRFFEVEAADGSTLYGHVAIPPGLAPGERRPVLLYVYGGPHAQLVQDSWLGGAPLWLQALAAEGYVVCRLDNRGTPNRGIEFEQSIFRRLGTIEVDDQLKAVEWLKSQPFADTDRIAVHGWSYGGYMTLRLLLLAPETFVCGISGAPVTDWAMYETGYGERYMDTPADNPGGYELASCLPLAEKLQRPLLLVHGTDDRTVMWSHSLRFVDRCIKAGKTLTYFPYPMQKHGLRGKHRVHFLRMMHTFLHQHLGAKKK